MHAEKTEQILNAKQQYKLHIQDLQNYLHFPHYFQVFPGLPIEAICCSTAIQKPICSKNTRGPLHIAGAKTTNDNAVTRLPTIKHR